jgi:hypothetical protein
MNGNYEVALTELIYPINYFNFVSKEPLIATYTPPVPTVPKGPRRPYPENPSVRVPRPRLIRESVNWEMKSGYFKNEEELTKYMSSELTKICGENKALFSYDDESKKITFKFLDYTPKKFADQPDEIPREYSTAIREINRDYIIDDGENEIQIDYSDERIYLNTYLYGLRYASNLVLEKAFYDRFLAGTFDILAGQRLMYVYSDIVSPHLVGDVKVPLLRVVTPKGKRDEMTNVTFTNPYYLPVARRGFDTIEININNELGIPMPFTGGKSVAILHFRRTQ